MMSAMPGNPPSDRAGPSVSIIIPTLNEEQDLPTAMEATGEQTFRDFEVLVVDSGSRDGTKDIAMKAGARIVDYPGRLMGARWKGFVESRGEAVLYLDADQVLYPDTLARAVEAMKDKDMLVLEETSYRPSNCLQRELCRQKAAMHEEFDPVSGSGPNLYPRFFRRTVLEKAYESLDEGMMAKVFAYEDGLLFQRTRAVSRKVGLLRNGVQHMEERDWLELMRHSYKAGRSARSVDMSALVEDEGRSESQWERLSRSIKGRYLTLSLVKELFFRLGYRST